MGAKQFTDTDSQRISEIAQQVGAQFDRDYTAAFQDAVIAKIKSAHTATTATTTATAPTTATATATTCATTPATANAPPPATANTATTATTPATTPTPALQLLPAPTPTQALRVGFLTKIGGNVKSWRRRFFVASNRSDNYTIVYYTDDSMQREKGRICCCGYRVQSFTPQEVGWYGSFGIKLTSGDKRQWLMRAGSDHEHSAWLQVLMNACAKAKPSPLQEVIFESAFRSALRSTRRAYGYHGVHSMVGYEVDMLESLVHCVLADKDCLPVGAVGAVGA
eukprot:CAMPEP_0173285808 /NCGR_PEP_ID=MMETSP1143-20121109/8831_1 /TAXON_ID=483371 /ORGANISM="non described non described, Strain CCMP2298" /LENGTH=279 /DNA_ID=CAMNT_0014224031 /DNA_START=54 /DNA_END=890 /DNA_ORIENTATION=-